MLFMVIENFRNGDAGPVYRRLAERGRLLPVGLTHKESWVDADLGRCFQLMKCEDAALIDCWTAAWSDLIDFEIVPVISSAAAAEAISPQI